LASGFVVNPWWDRWFPAQNLAPGTLEAYAQQFGSRAVAPDRFL
jgi:hypothetical protein